MPLDELKYDSIWVALGVLATGVLEYFIEHPSAAIGSVVMCLVAWDRRMISRLKKRQQKAKTEQEETSAKMVKLKYVDWLRMKEEAENEDAENMKGNGPKED